MTASYQYHVQHYHKNNLLVDKVLTGSIVTPIKAPVFAHTSLTLYSEILEYSAGDWYVLASASLPQGTVEYRISEITAGMNRYFAIDATGRITLQTGPTYTIFDSNFNSSTVSADSLFKNLSNSPATVEIGVVARNADYPSQTTLLNVSIQVVSNNPVWTQTTMSDAVLNEDDVASFNISSSAALTSGAQLSYALAGTYASYFTVDSQGQIAITSTKAQQLFGSITTSPAAISLQLTASHASIPSLSTERMLQVCLLYTSPSPRDGLLSRMPSSA